MNSGRLSRYWFTTSDRWTAPEPSFRDIGGRDDAVHVEGFTELEPAANCRPSRPKENLPPCLSASERGLTHWPSEPVHSLGYYTLPDITVQGNGNLWQEGKICSGPEIQQSFVREPLTRQPKYTRTGETFRVRKLRSPALVFVGWDYNNFGHWCMDILPRLSTIQQHDPALLNQFKTVIPRDMNPVFIDMLRTVFGIKKRNIVTYRPDEEVLHLGTAIVPTMVHRDYHYHPTISGFFDRISARPQKPVLARGNTGFLYVSRRQFASNANQPRRLLANTGEIETLVNRYGFEQIEPQMFSWQDQVQLFANAKVVIGEHGSAMKNLLFAPRSVRAVVLNFLNATQAAIAAMREQAYIPIASKEFDKHQDEEIPYSVNIHKVEQCLTWAMDSL